MELVSVYTALGFLIGVLTCVIVDRIFTLYLIYKSEKDRKKLISLLYGSIQKTDSRKGLKLLKFEGVNKNEDGDKN